MPMAASPSSSAVRHHLLRMRGAAQEGEVRGDGEFGVGAHWRSHANECSRKQPCTNQRAASSRGRKGLRGRARSGGRRHPRRGNNRASGLAAASCRRGQLSVRMRGWRARATIRRRCVPGLARRRPRRSRRASENAAADLRGRAPDPSAGSALRQQQQRTRGSLPPVRARCATPSPSTGGSISARSGRWLATGSNRRTLCGPSRWRSVSIKAAQRSARSSVPIAVAGGQVRSAAPASVRRG